MSGQDNVVVYNKLVRDKVVDKIRANGGVPTYRILNKIEIMQESRNKVAEEARELAEAQGRGDIIREAADVLEAYEIFLKTHHLCMEEVKIFQARKKQESGGFDKHIFLESVETTEG